MSDDPALDVVWTSPHGRCSACTGQMPHCSGFALFDQCSVTGRKKVYNWVERYFQYSFQEKRLPDHHPR